LLGFVIFNKFGFSADETYENCSNFVRTKSSHLSQSRYHFFYPTISKYQVFFLQNLQLYLNLLGKKIKKSTKVFNDKSNGSPRHYSTKIQSNLQYNQQRCMISSNVLLPFLWWLFRSKYYTVIGKAADVRFKTTGKVILKRMARRFWKQTPKKKPTFVEEVKKVLHQPSFFETKASGLRSDLITCDGNSRNRSMMKIYGDWWKKTGGRPSTRANIIETLFKALVHCSK
jgi:DNA topoisomerase-3